MEDNRTPEAPRVLDYATPPPRRAVDWRRWGRAALHGTTILLLTALNTLAAASLANRFVRSSAARGTIKLSIERGFFFQATPDDVRAKAAKVAAMLQEPPRLRRAEESVAATLGSSVHGELEVSEIAGDTVYMKYIASDPAAARLVVEKLSEVASIVDSAAPGMSIKPDDVYVSTSATYGPWGGLVGGVVGLIGSIALVRMSNAARRAREAAALRA